ncbi:hypothetical protein M011DRAFT_85229 [Sporormia fimetaria CBS 119925]|uniref:Uncharacterized protein n=1 Tax=Sporormia fimetaria CBS 119925 TaxID=1340428 RepID=A0A6A6V8S7_9PLEO|nr:hypothetical protein M011DRAFT_85229 [Sporormia fimetaria CBS 119925]
MTGNAVTLQVYGIAGLCETLDVRRVEDYRMEDEGRRRNKSEASGRSRKEGTRLGRTHQRPLHLVRLTALKEPLTDHSLHPDLPVRCWWQPMISHCHDMLWSLCLGLPQNAHYTINWTLSDASYPASAGKVAWNDMRHRSRRVSSCRVKNTTEGLVQQCNFVCLEA